MKPSRAALSYGETLNGGGLSVATHFVSGAFPDRVRHLMGEIPGAKAADNRLMRVHEGVNKDERRSRRDRGKKAERYGPRIRPSNTSTIGSNSLSD